MRMEFVELEGGLRLRRGVVVRVASYKENNRRGAVNSDCERCISIVELQRTCLERILSVMPWVITKQEFYVLTHSHSSPVFVHVDRSSSSPDMREISTQTRSHAISQARVCAVQPSLKGRCGRWR